jgi:hypothetical protein
MQLGLFGCLQALAASWSLSYQKDRLPLVAYEPHDAGSIYPISILRLSIVDAFVRLTLWICL